MTTRTIAESWDAYLVDSVPIDATAERIVALRRAFFAGALEAAATPSADRERLMAELIAHGRSVGTAAERARV